MGELSKHDAAMATHGPETHSQQGGQHREVERARSPTAKLIALYNSSRCGIRPPINGAIVGQNLCRKHQIAHPQASAQGGIMLRSSAAESSDQGALEPSTHDT